MAHIKITSIKRDTVLSDADFAWIEKHLNQWLPLMSLCWSKFDGKVFSIAVHTPTSCVSIFPYSNHSEAGIEYEVSYTDSYSTSDANIEQEANYNDSH